MLDDVTRMRRLPVAMPVAAINRRLGRRKDAQVVSAVQEAQLTQWMAEAFVQCRPVGVFGCLAIVDNDGHKVTLSDASVIENDGVARLLAQCQYAWLAASTIGPELVALVNQALAAGDGAKAVVADAVGSETVEAAMDVLQNYAGTTLRRRGWQLSSKRFSVGYGGWALSAQAQFFAWLPLADMGLRLTPSAIIEPEKTITAIAGIRSS
ncbi:MAG: hypothetical protein GX617_11290 [Lentisphaerae bacterium]|nr:hypothetical protein [Lentisphaeria bacterium]NLE55514.1 hypothetical protein [Lentisphaerota bacterium]